MKLNVGVVNTKNGAAFLLAIMCVLLMTGCGTIAGTEAVQTVAEKEVWQENTVSVNLDDVAAQSDPNGQYCDYLRQVTEKDFIGEEGIDSVDATVTYDEETEQYSIKLSIETNGEVDEKQVELYKSILSKTYEEIALVVDGEVM